MIQRSYRRSSGVDPLLGHLAVALSHYVEQARRQGLELPDEVRALAAWTLRLAQASGAATSRPQTTELDCRFTTSDPSGMSEPTLLLRPEDAAVALGVSRRTVERLISSGELPTVQLGRSVRVPRDRLRQYVASLPPRAGAGPGGVPEMSQNVPTDPVLSGGYRLHLFDENGEVVELHFDPVPDSVTTEERVRVDQLLDGPVEAWLHRLAHGGVGETDLRLAALLAAQRAGVTALSDDPREDWETFCDGVGELLSWVELPFSTDLVVRSHASEGSLQ